MLPTVRVPLSVNPPEPFPRKMRACGAGVMFVLISVIAKSASPSWLKSAVVMPSGRLLPMPTAIVEPAKFRVLLLATMELLVAAVALNAAASFPAVS